MSLIHKISPPSQITKKNFFFKKISSIIRIPKKRMTIKIIVINKNLDRCLLFSVSFRIIGANNQG